MILLLTGLLMSFSVLANGDRPHIQVQGNCEIKVIPDRGMLTFTSENQSKNQKEAVQKTNDQIKKLKHAIEELKLSHLELKNTEFHVYPVREYEKERYVDKGFRASLSLEVITSDIPKIGETILTASKVGITNVGSLQTFLSLEKSQKEYLKCLDIAADDALNKAKQLAKKLDFKIGDVIALNEVPNIQRPAPYQENNMMMARESLAASKPVQIEAGSQLYSTNIQVTFKIR